MTKGRPPNKRMVGGLEKASLKRKGPYSLPLPSLKKGKLSI